MYQWFARTSPEHFILLTSPHQDEAAQRMPASRHITGVSKTRKPVRTLPMSLPIFLLCGLATISITYTSSACRTPGHACIVFNRDPQTRLPFLWGWTLGADAFSLATEIGLPAGRAIIRDRRCSGLMAHRGHRCGIPGISFHRMVSATRFERATSRSQGERSTKLSYTLMKECVRSSHEENRRPICFQCQTYHHGF